MERWRKGSTSLSLLLHTQSAHTHVRAHGTYRNHLKLKTLDSPFSLLDSGDGPLSRTPED